MSRKDMFWEILQQVVLLVDLEAILTYMSHLTLEQLRAILQIKALMEGAIQKILEVSLVK